jgi:hypothetical protein
MTLPARDERPEQPEDQHGRHAGPSGMTGAQAASWRQAAEEVRAMLRDPERAHQRPPGRS